MSRALHRTVLRTRTWPVVSSLYRGAYAGALAASARGLFALPGTSAVYLHRGLSRAGWEPGVSDIDLIVVRESGPETGLEAESLARLAKRFKTLRRLFPMLGDLWLGSPEELEAYMRWGGLRASEDIPGWRRLLGALLETVPLSESPLKRRWLDPWAWLFVSHMELGRRLFVPGRGVPEKSAADLRKLYWDARRFSDFIEGGAGAGLKSRAELRETTPEAGRMTDSELWLDSSLRLARASRLVLEKTGSSSIAPVSFPEPPRSSEPGNRLSALLDAGAAPGAVADEPYHTYLLLKEGAAAADYEKAAQALILHGAPGVPLVLEPAAWALALQSSYLGAPLGWPGSGGGRGSGAGETLFPRWGARASGDLPLEAPLLDPRLRWETAAEAASWMLLWWRSLWIDPGSSNRFVLYHLYTRALGLRLVLDGTISGPFCDWELLIARASARFEEDRRFLAGLAALLRRETAASLDCPDRTALAPGHLPALGRLMASLRRALEKDPAPAG